MLVGNDVVRVDVDGDWYELKTVLGWYDDALIHEASRRILIPVERGNLVRDGAVEVRMQNAPTDLVRLRARLRAWSHSEPLTEDNIKRIPPAHAAILLSRIGELEEAERALSLSEPEKNSPGG
jgi:hypothetical protein